MTTENSRADALTVPTISREAFYAIVRTALMWYRSDNPSRYLNDEQVDANDAEFVGKLADEHAKILAASPVEQPAAAPIDDRGPPAVSDLSRFPTVLRKMWSGTEVQQWIDDNIKPLVQERHHDYHCGSNATPSPADERASWADEIIGDLQESFDTEGITENDSGDALIRLSSAIAAVEEAAQARAASANETGAEVSGECFIVIGHGESDIPEAKIVEKRDDLLDAVIGMIYGSPSDAPADARALYAQDLEDEDQWMADKWSCEFEIGGIVVWHVGLHPLTTKPPMAAEAVAKIRVSHLGHHAELESYVARSLPMGVHEVYAAPQPAQADARPPMVPVPKDMIEARAQGRAEALALLLAVDTDTFCCEYIADGGSLPSGERNEGWDEDALKELLRTDDSAYSLVLATEDEYWHNLGLREDAERVLAEARTLRASAQADARVGLTATQLATIRLGLTAAKHFIANGIELGFIRMPDANCPDPAHDTPKLVDEALALLQGANQS